MLQVAGARPKHRFGEEEATLKQSEKGVVGGGSHLWPELHLLRRSRVSDYMTCALSPSSKFSVNCPSGSYGSDGKDCYLNSVAAHSGYPFFGTL